MRFGSTIRFLIAGVLLLSSAHASETRRQTPRSHPMRRAYVKDTFGPAGMGRVAAGAALRRGKGSYGQHLASSFEGHVAGKTVEYGVASMRHEDLHNHRSMRRGFRPENAARPRQHRGYTQDDLGKAHGGFGQDIRGCCRRTGCRMCRNRRRSAGSGCRCKRSERVLAAEKAAGLQDVPYPVAGPLRNGAATRVILI